MFSCHQQVEPEKKIQKFEVDNINFVGTKTTFVGTNAGFSNYLCVSNIG